MSKFCQAVRLVVAVVVTTPLVLVVEALALVECLLKMVSGALIRLGISILRTLSAWRRQAPLPGRHRCPAALR